VQRGLSNAVLPAERESDDPLIVVTHSMGGTIMYDIPTVFRPDLQVDCWISVGSQVAQFHSLGFLASQLGANAEAPPRAPLSTSTLKRWYNIYDPLDPLNLSLRPCSKKRKMFNTRPRGDRCAATPGAFASRGSMHWPPIKSSRRCLIQPVQARSAASTSEARA
jgi:hypothetical protein